MARTNNDVVIGVDLGNNYIQISVIVGADPKTKRGGVIYELIEPTEAFRYGFPSAFHYSKKRGELYGADAVEAIPPKNCIRCLKRDMKKKDGTINSVTIDGKVFTYDYMITAVIQSALRMAEEVLEKRLHIFTNKISLAYPASMGANDKTDFVKFVERATFKNGQHAEVVATITEPAAGALDSHAQSETVNESTDLSYDFGAGTMDVSVVRVYPNGKTRENASKYYYDVLYSDGLPDIGGTQCDEAVVRILQRKAGKEANNAQVAEAIRTNAELTKLALSREMTYQPKIVFSNGDYIDEVTREEFEKECDETINKTMDLVAKAFEMNKDVKIDRIVLMGGASQMPIVTRKLQERFPAYKDKIVFHDPSKAIASGAARYGTKEEINGFGETVNAHNNNSEENKNTVVLRTIRDIGIRYYYNNSDNQYIETYIPRGTPIPYTSQWIDAQKRGAGSFATFNVFEANTTTPDADQTDRDYDLVCSIRHDHGQRRPKGFTHQSRLIIDDRHLASIEVRDDGRDSVTYPFEVRIDHLFE